MDPERKTVELSPKPFCNEGQLYCSRNKNANLLISSLWSHVTLHLCELLFHVSLFTKLIVFHSHGLLSCPEIFPKPPKPSMLVLLLCSWEKEHGYLSSYHVYTVHKVFWLNLESRTGMFQYSLSGMVVSLLFNAGSGKDISGRFNISTSMCKQLF